MIRKDWYFSAYLDRFFPVVIICIRLFLHRRNQRSGSLTGETWGGCESQSFGHAEDTGRPCPEFFWAGSFASIFLCAAPLFS